ncbi:peptidoglycan DD-metalloendopeptidase family protein [Microbispora catharanthi]|uniref:Peptidoglycan DD-metalloendopeptidase family protein n=2 Tax=Microbispora catharanthi TaxID=1712871 RepID=A0A5N6B861_9ACTN|nr:peptidoglycan DD-metalloendopeptidase family protein [Microbispora catharanthi]
MTPYAATTARAPGAVRVLTHRPADPSPTSAPQSADPLPAGATRTADALPASEPRPADAKTFGPARSIGPVGESPAGPDRAQDAVPAVTARSRGNAHRVGPVAPGPMGPRGDASGWRWPLAGPAHPIRRFDPPPQRWLAGHRGVDLAAQPGEKVMAAGPGVVGLAERVAGRGVVTISHPDGLRTTYLPVRAVVRPGDVVAAGQVIGVVEEDAVAHCAAPCLHWGLLRGRLYLDPLLLFGRGQVRLLPRRPVGEARWPS